MYSNRSLAKIGRTSLSKMISARASEHILTAESRKACIANMRQIPIIPTGTPGQQKRAAVLIPLCVDDGQMSLLYTLRSMGLSSHKGDVSFPGGKFDPTDRDLVETALRETEEELGIPRKLIDVWGEANACPSRNFELAVTPVVGFIKDFNEIPLKPNPSEVEEVFTVSLEKLCDPQYFGVNNFKNGWTLPVFMGGKHKIWGLTAVFTHVFLSSLLSKEDYSMQFLHLSTPSERSEPKSKV